MVIFISKKIKSLNFVLSARILKNPYNYIISNGFGKEAEEINDDILKFIKVFENNFNKKNTKLYKENINDLYIKKDENLAYKNTEAIYEITNNNIVVKKKYKFTMFHELFHMASANHVNTGFEVDIDGVIFNRGLNEGYTEFLAHKYFGDIENDQISYLFEVMFARMIEELVGKELMEELYLKCDGRDLESELTKYMGTKAYYMLSMLDRLLPLREKENIDSIKLDKATKQIFIYIVEGYIKKEYLLYKDNKIDINEALKNIHDYVDRWNQAIVLDNIDYEFTNDKILNKIYKNNLVGLEKKIS